MRIKTLRERIVAELLSTPKSRKYSSSRHPDPEPVGDRFSVDCISTIVKELMEAHGFRLLESTKRNRRSIVFGKLDESNRPQYIRIAWNSAQDTFSPSEDVTEVDSVIFQSRFIRKYFHPNPPEGAAGGSN